MHDGMPARRARPHFEVFRSNEVLGERINYVEGEYRAARSTRLAGAPIRPDCQRKKRPRSFFRSLKALRDEHMHGRRMRVELARAGGAQRDRKRGKNERIDSASSP